MPEIMLLQEESNCFSSGSSEQNPFGFFWKCFKEQQQNNTGLEG